MKAYCLSHIAGPRWTRTLKGTAICDMPYATIAIRDLPYAADQCGDAVPGSVRAVPGHQHSGPGPRGEQGELPAGAAPGLRPRQASHRGRLRLWRRRRHGAQAGAVLRGGGVVQLRRDPIALLSARGRPFRHDDAVRLSLEPRFTLLCGHYKDVDQRVAEGLATEEISVGDLVLSGGEPAALCVIDAVVRLLPGALGDHESASGDSHYEGLLSPPSYTRPPEYRGPGGARSAALRQSCRYRSLARGGSGTDDPGTAP